ncbi:hypothetical protein F383_03843 [Gossypium arboreum]|uniref:Uncharacterized protein n=1 Tax=Gossypium arboreum TaxID=29729 RepID=A0A0B0NHZ2_GOSAR|nr:hypothetical protein F383_03843 [Gossypium arboreum]
MSRYFQNLFFQVLFSKISSYCEK